MLTRSICLWPSSKLGACRTAVRALILISIVIVSVMPAACRAASYSTNPISDAFVATGPGGNLSGDNFGAAGALAVAAGDLPQGEFQSVLEFDLSGAESSFDAQFGTGQWSVQSVALQLTATPHSNVIFNDPAAGQFNISLLQNNGWIEGTGTGGKPTTDGISYSSLQGVFINNGTDQGLGTFGFGGGTSGSDTYILGLTSGLVGDVQAGNDLSLRMYAADNEVSYLFSSRTSGAPSSPELIITATPEPESLALGLMGVAILSLWQRTKRSRT